MAIRKAIAREQRLSASSAGRLCDRQTPLGVRSDYPPPASDYTNDYTGLRGFCHESREHGAPTFECWRHTVHWHYPSAQES